MALRGIEENTVRLMVVLGMIHPVQVMAFVFRQENVYVILDGLEGAAILPNVLTTVAMLGHA